MTSVIASHRLLGLRHFNLKRVYSRNITTLQIAHSSWFKLEDQGMADFELLARGSAFFVRGPTTGYPIALVSAHVAAPHRFRNYFPQAWLQHVSDADCRSVLENRSKDGKHITSTIMTQPLIQGFRHASLDVAAFLVENIEENSKFQDIPVLDIPSDDKSLQEGDHLSIAGFRLVGESGSGTEAVISSEVQGNVSEIMNSRIFVDTGSILTEMGMCGGPAVLSQDRTSCVGILEGLVPAVEKRHSQPNEVHKRLQNKSVLVGAQELRMFLHDVETEASKLRVSSKD